MNTKLITEIKKNAFIVVLDEADTSEQEIEKLFNYAESKNYRIFFHHGIKTEKVFVLFNQPQICCAWRLSVITPLLVPLPR